MNSSPRAKLKENWKLRVRDIVQGKIHWHMFSARQRLLCLLSFECLVTRVKTCLRIAHRLPRGMSSLRVFFNDFMNKQKFSFVCNNHTTLSHLKLNFVVIDVRFESWRASRRWFSRILPSFSWGIFGLVNHLDQSPRASQNVRWILSHNITLTVWCVETNFSPVK